jgi:hypothetical protein
LDGNPVGIDTSGSSVAPPLDGQLRAPLDHLGEADDLGAPPNEFEEADELDEGEFEGELEVMVDGPQAVALTMANATTAASGAWMGDFTRTSQEAD